MTENTPAVERWLPVPGYEGLYEVSDLGRVMTRRRKGSPGGLRKLQHRGPYLSLMLYANDVPTEWRVHALVAAAFIGPRPTGFHVCHRDGNPLNNTLANLYYGSVSDNIRDAVRHGTHYQTAKTHCAKGHPYSPDNTLERGNGRECRTCRESRYGRKKAA